MSFPPSIIRLRVRSEDAEKDLGLWVPVLLVWPVALVLGIALAPLFVLAAVVLWPSGYGRMLLLAGPRLFGLYSCMNGLEVDVRSGRNLVQVRFM